MSEIESELALISPAVFAVLSMVLAGRNGKPRGVLPIVVTGLVALVIGFFVTFTIAWGVTNSFVAVWLTALAIGVLIGMSGHLLMRVNSNG